MSTKALPLELSEADQNAGVVHRQNYSTFLWSQHASFTWLLPGSSRRVSGILRLNSGIRQLEVMRPRLDLALALMTLVRAYGT